MIKRALLRLTAAANVTQRPLYLHFQATSPVDPRVLDAMLPFWTEQYGLPWLPGLCSQIISKLTKLTISFSRIMLFI